MQFISPIKLRKYNMPAPLQTVITLPLYGHSYTYMQSECQKGMRRMRKPPLKENKFRRTKGKFNFSN